MASNLPPIPIHAPFLDPMGYVNTTWIDWFKQARFRAGNSVALTNKELEDALAVIQNIATDRILGRDTAGSGDPEQLTVGGGLEFTGSGGIRTSEFTGDVTKSAGGTALSIANEVVNFAKLLSTDWSSSQSTSGYQKLGSGLYVQWGVTGSLASGSSTSINFPTAFPTACFQVISGIRDNSGVAVTTTGQWGTGGYGVSSFSIYNRTSEALTFNWFAVGN